MKRRMIALIGAVVVAVAVMFEINAVPVHATCQGPTFLGLRAWYDGLEGTCDNLQFSGSDANGIAKTVWIIIVNIGIDISIVAGVVATGFVMYGGYLYILARGDENKVAKGKKTLVNAIIGLVIATMAVFITNILKFVLSGGGLS